jgi:DNA polymerase-3 subunit gamma/tau
VRIAPQVGDYKIFIIDEVHMLSQSAFNAFLKTLEEPPAHAVFILATTEKHKILPTILSRCQIFDFHRIQVNDIVDHLKRISKNEGVKADEKALHIIAQKADGALRDALSIFDQIVSFSNNNVSYDAVLQNLNVLDYDYYFKITDAAITGDIPANLLTYNDILANGFDGSQFVIGLAEHLRNLLVCKDESTLSLLDIPNEIKEKYLEQSSKVTADFILTGLDLLRAVEGGYKAAKNKRLHVELCLMKLSSIMHTLEKA